MSLLQKTDRVTEIDKNLLVFRLPDDVTSSRPVNVLARAAVLRPLTAGIIISIATLVGALLN